MSEKNLIIVSAKNKICTLTLNDPEKRNVLSPKMLNELARQLKNLEIENKVRCIVIKVAGNKAFSSGYNISEIKDDDMTREFREDHPLENCLEAIENFPYPIIAMMNGHTFGAGLELAVTCDLRICSEDIKMALPPAKLGMVYSYSGTKKFLNLIGPAYTKELFFTGETIDAERAEKIGLVNFIIEKDKIEKFTHKIAEKISQNAPLSLKTIKETINIWQRNQTLSNTDKEIIKNLFEKIQESKDYREGQRAFQEKRKPEFRGK